MCRPMTWGRAGKPGGGIRATTLTRPRWACAPLAVARAGAATTTPALRATAHHRLPPRVLIILAPDILPISPPRRAGHPDRPGASTEPRPAPSGRPRGP